MRSLLHIEQADTVRFEDPAGNSVMLDYIGLKDRHGVKKVQLVMFIERGGAELVSELAKANGAVGFTIFEDAPEAAFKVEEVEAPDGSRYPICDCEKCMIDCEKRHFLKHLLQRARARGDLPSQDDESDWESEDDLQQIPSTAERPREHAEESQSFAEAVTESSSGAVPVADRHADDFDFVRKRFLDDEANCEYGRVIPGAFSSGGSIPRDTEEESGDQQRRIRVPTTEEFRTASLTLRKMR